MTYGMKLYIWGDYACFTRLEMKTERVSYDVMTPSAARGILEAIHWKPAIRWVIDRIHVLKPIRFETIRRNEVGNKIPETKARSAMRRSSLEGLFTVVEDDRQQRAATVLRDVGYVIEAHFELTDRAEPDDTAAKHHSMFKRRAAKGQCFHRPCLGVREFPADFTLIEADLPASALAEAERDSDLGWMLHDIDYVKGMVPRFFRAKMKAGVIAIPPFDAAEVKT